VHRLKLKPLASQEVETIYEKCLDFLSKKGVRVRHPQALRTLDRAGARVDFEKEQVRFAREIVETALEAAPGHFILAARDGEADLTIPHPDGAFYTASNTGATSYLDPDSNTYRGVTQADTQGWAQLMAILRDIDICAFPTLADVPGKIADICALKIYLENTPKHIWVQPHRSESLEYLFQLAIVASGGEDALKKKPVISVCANSLTPLDFPAMDMEVIIQACRYGVPIYLCALPSAGGSSPVTIAGTVLLSSIELLAMVVMSQVIAPGTPVFCGHHRLTLDMATGRSLLASVEAVLGEVASSQFIQEAFHLPTFAWGYGTDSHVPDGQSMLEGALLGSHVSLAGTDILEGAGGLDVCLGISPVQLIIDDTLARIFRRGISGVKVDEESLAWKEILNTLPGGHFLEKEHTMRHCREALRPGLFNYQPREIWDTEGGKDLNARTLERYRAMRKDLRPLELPREVQREMDLIVQRARKNLVG
jgi:trimethylamine:corrinoid methyltransferase-like protein